MLVVKTQAEIDEMKETDSYKNGDIKIISTKDIGNGLFELILEIN